MGQLLGTILPLMVLWRPREAQGSPGMLRDAQGGPGVRRGLRARVVVGSRPVVGEMRCQRAPRNLLLEAELGWTPLLSGGWEN